MRRLTITLLMRSKDRAMRSRAIAIAATGALLLATSALAVDHLRVPLATSTGGVTVQLGHAEDGYLFDADFAGTTSAVAWQELVDPDRTLRVSRSDVVSFEDFSTLDLARDVDDRSVAICGADVVVAYLQRPADDERRLWLARLPGDGGSVAWVEVRAGVGPRGSIDVACTVDRVWVAWSESVDDEWHALVRSISLPALQLSTFYDAGPASRHRVALAATDEHGLLAWQDGKRIRVAQLVAGPPDDQRLIALSTRTAVRHGSAPILDADGETVALGYDRWNVAFIRLSRDGGVTFGRPGRFDRASFGGTPRELGSLAVTGPDIVATVVVFYGPLGDQVWDRYRLRSHDLGRTWKTSRVTHPRWAIPKDGFLVTPRGVKLAEAYTDGEYAEAFDLRVRREGRARP